MDNGLWANTRDKIGLALMETFRGVYCEDSMPMGINLSHLISPSVSNVDNANLTLIPNEAETHRVIFSMGVLKACWPDGMPTFFYKSYWDTVGREVICS